MKYYPGYRVYFSIFRININNDVFISDSGERNNY
jgi:hypothetical protein